MQKSKKRNRNRARQQQTPSRRNQRNQHNRRGNTKQEEAEQQHNNTAKEGEQNRNERTNPGHQRAASAHADLEKEGHAAGTAEAARPGAWKPTHSWSMGINIATANMNSKGTMIKLLKEWARSGRYHVVLVQEHHVANAKELQEIATALAKGGWGTTWTPAEKTALGTSVGVGIAWQ